MINPFWKDLFTDEDFAWRFKMRSGEAREFFANTEDHESLIQEKSHCLHESPERYSVWTDQGLQLFEQMRELISDWTPNRFPVEQEWNPVNLAKVWEPDFLIMDQSSMKLVGGCICFPSSWKLSKVIGLPVGEIHDLVPRLNEQIGSKIYQFLKRLEPGRSFLRENWGLTQTSDLNYHPDLRRPKLEPGSPMSTGYLRVEHQIFTGIPGGVLMGIRIQSCPITDLKSDPVAWKALNRKLKTMPVDVSQYKSLPWGSVKES